MDPATLTALYFLLGSLGLVVTDTYFNANTMFLDTTVADSVKEEGYEPEVVNGIFISEVKKITGTPSLVKAPSIQSSHAKPVSTALAEAAGLESALSAIHSLMGVVPPKMVASVIAEDQVQRVQAVGDAPVGGAGNYVVGEVKSLKLILTGYDPNSGYFDIGVEGESENEDLDHLIRDAAFKAVLKLDPYLALLHDVNRRAVAGEDLAPARALIDAQIEAAPKSQVHEHRALMENLRGVVALLDGDQAAARGYFLTAQASDPQQAIGFLNCAFLDVHEDRFAEALKNIEKVIHPTYWPLTGNRKLLASAYTIKGVAETEMGRFREAEASFQKAASLNPQSSEVYVYWSRMLKKAARPAEAERRILQARQNSMYFENYPEMALLYFWLTEAGDQPLERRASQAEAL